MCVCVCVCVVVLLNERSESMSKRKVRNERMQGECLANQKQL